MRTPATTFADKIYIRDLAIPCIIGINPGERKRRQTVVINLVMETDLSRAGRTDDIQDTVDYKALKLRLRAMVLASKYFLIEKLARKIADLCLEDPRIRRVTVTVDKPRALNYARSVAVEITRRPRRPDTRSH